jgi:CBS domain-containing protein
MRKLSDVIFSQTPVTLRTLDSVQDAAQAMALNRTGSVVVLNASGQLAGIFTGRDAVKRVLAKGLSASATTLGDVMTTPVATISPDQSALDALRMMWAGDYRHLPVVRDGRVLGVVTRGDFSGLEQDRFDDERDLWEHLR